MSNICAIKKKGNAFTAMAWTHRHRRQALDMYIYIIASTISAPHRLNLYITHQHLYSSLLLLFRAKADTVE